VAAKQRSSAQLTVTLVASGLEGKPRNLPWVDRSAIDVRDWPRVATVHGLTQESSSVKTSPMIFVAWCAGNGSPPSASATSVAKSSTACTPPTRT
jgi:hypothetical protein